MEDRSLRLDQFLKLEGIVRSGGEAKQLVRAGEVRVNGEVEIRRGRKLQSGDIVEMDGRQWTVQSSGLR